MDHRIIPRGEWGARHPDGFRAAPLPASELWMHHTAGPAANGAAVIRSLEDTGQARFGGGMSYTFLVTMDGAIYEGHTIGRQGAHTGGHNDAGRAVCLVGNFEDDHPSPEMIAAVVWLTRHGHEHGWWQARALTGGHRDVSATACPGQHAYDAIGEINRLAGEEPTEEDDLTEEQDAMLRAVYQQLTGSTEVGKYEGWPAKPDESDRSKTLVDYTRAVHAKVMED